MKKIREALPMLILSVLILLGCVWQFAAVLDRGNPEVEIHRSK